MATKVREERRRVREMRDEEIGIELADLREKLFTLRSQQVTEKVEDTSRFGKIRKQIARLETETTARRLAARAGAAGAAEGS